MVSPRSIAALAFLALQLGGCAAADADAARRHKAAIEEIERRHTFAVENMGGGSGI